ncbi:unnamed protein product [Symbiodinium sp. KB8]|nr:unnamed protein product [Symbiodinium sp. KB8]
MTNGHMRPLCFRRHFYIVDSKLSLVAIRIRTGRRHQIRTHLAFVGHPTVCDGKYTETEIFNKDRQWRRRRRLPCRQISCCHYGSYDQRVSAGTGATWCWVTSV